MFSTFPLVSSSTMRTWAPRATSASTRCEPINDAPPVTRTFLRLQMVPSSSSRGFFHHLHKPLEFRYSSISPRCFPRTPSHCRKLLRIFTQRAHRLRNPGRIVRIGNGTAPRIANDPRRVAFRGSDHQDGPAGGKNGVEL